MNIFILIKCFLIGVVGNLALGPIFLLTFNRGALFGFTRGISSALAASVADGILFAFGLVGMLSLISQVHIAEDALYFVGGSFLLLVGIYYFVHIWRPKQLFITQSSLSPTCVGTFLKAFFMTVVNPLTIGYFAATSVGILRGIDNLTFCCIFILSCIVALGTFSALSIVSFISSNVRFAIPIEKLLLINKITGVIFIGFGFYLLFIFIFRLQILNSFF